MKKFKFNRFNIIIICVTFVLLLVFISTFFHTYSDYATRDASKIEGDTVYINDLANDYYYLLGQNYVGDINSNTVNYTESTIKMVTVKYYGYPSSDPTLTGYVSLAEQQNKFVYYKYFPIVNNQISIELIDNPFTLRPVGKGFGGWTSNVGTVTKDSQTNVYTLTIPSSTTEVNVYANWQNAKVVFLKGEDGDDNFDGSSNYNAVASWGRAFELLRTNNANTADRELNIIVLTGPLDHSINYTRTVTHTWNYSYTYTDNTSFENGGEYLIEYKNGNNRYALSENYTNVAMETLTTTTKPSDRSLWTITHDSNGYLIRNKDSGNYLGHEQYYNDQVAIYVRSTPVYWDYDTNLRTFFATYNITLTRFNYTLQDTISNNNYLIADANSYSNTNNTQSLNILNYSLTNTNIDSDNYDQSNQWRVTQSGTGYTIQNANNNNYLNYSDLNGTTNLLLNSTPLVWNYDSTNHTLSTQVTHYQTVYTFGTSTLASGATCFIGYQDGNNYYLLNHSRNFVAFTNGSQPSSSDYEWTLESAGGSNFYVRYGTNNYLRVRTNGNVENTTSTRNRTSFSLNNNRLYGNNRYLYNNNGTLSSTDNANNGRQLFNVSVNETTAPNGQDNMFLRFNNNAWSLSTTSSTVRFVSYVQQTNSNDYHFNLRYDTGTSSFTFERSTTGTGLYFATYEENRTMTGTNRGNMANNNNYNNYSIGATITSVYDNTDYRSNATWTLTNTSYFRTLVYADLQLENLKISSTGYQSVSDANTSTDLRTTSSSLIGNAHNVRIGRGMTPDSWTNNDSVIFSFMQGAQNTTSTGTNSSSDSNHNFKFVVESGRYSGMMASHLRNNYNSTTYAYNHYGTIYTVIGNDYDRATNNNNLLDFYYRIGSKNYSGVNGIYNNVHGLAYLMTVKSGNIGANYFSTAVLVEDDPTDNDDAYAYSGIYVGGLTVSASNTNDDISSRVLIVEGGVIANINGGLRLQQTTGNNGVATRIYIKNGTVANIVGGAGVSTTYGNRYISVTGGNVLYSISAGSNGIAASDNDSQSGRLGGDTYVHVGGEAHIGTGTRATVYGVNKGSVLGAGNGTQSWPQSGRVNTSHVFVSGAATIEGNVYGGGNYGPVAVDSHVTIDGGTINGSVYGGANKKGVGSVNITSGTIYNVSFTDDLTPTNDTTYVISKMNGNTRNMLSVNNNNTTNIALTSGNQPGNVSRWLINAVSDGYTIRNTSNNRYIAYTTTSSPALTTRDDTTNAVWNYDTTNHTFYRDIDYTVSATASFNYNFGTITSGKEYVITNTNSNSANSLNSDIGITQLSTNTEPVNNAWIFTAVSSGYHIQNKGTGLYLTASSGTLTTSTTPDVWTWDNTNRRLRTGNYRVRYRSSGYFTIATSNYSVYLGEITVNKVTNNARYYLVYDSAWRISTTASSVMLSTFTSTSSIGYSVSSATDGDVFITMNGGHVVGAIYGGACEEGDIAGTVTINLNGGQIGYDTNNNGSVFGGGYGEATRVANGVDLNINDVSNVTVAGTIYGGSALGDIIGNIDVDAIDATGNGTITVSGDFYCGSMGDANDSTTGNIQGNCSITLDGGEYQGDVFGGNNANGSPSGTVTVTTGGNNATSIHRVFAGGNQADSTATSAVLNIENYSDIDEAYGGGNEAAVPNTRVNLNGGHADSLFGGSNQSGNITSTTIKVNGGDADYLYGGNNLGGTVGSSSIEVTGGHVDNLYGGGKQATIGTTLVELKNGSVDNTFGGGRQAGVTTSATIELKGSTCGTIYGGSDQSGNVPVSYVTVTSGSASTIYGGNNKGGVTTTSNVDISNISIGTVYGGGKEATTGTAKVTVHSGGATTLYGGGESASISTKTEVKILGGSVTTLYGGSNTSGTVPQSDVEVTTGTIGTIYGGNNAGGTTTATSIKVTTGNITNIYGGGNAADVGTTNIELNNSLNKITYIFGGCRAANATSTSVILKGGQAQYVFGGSNTSGNITNSYVEVQSNTNGTYDNVYGGNNAGGKTVTTDVRINGGSVGIAFGGGEGAQTDNANIIVDNATITNLLYGGGNNAAVNYNTSVTVRNNAVVTNSAFAGGNNGQVLGNASITVNTGGDIGQDLYGGGNNAGVVGNTTLILDGGVVRRNLYGGGSYGTVGGSTNVNIKNATIIGSAHAGGKGQQAVVSQNTNITVQGTSTIGGHVFGGGSAADTGTSGNNNSHGTVNITGGNITGNVYGGANTAVLYGETVVNIGYNAVTSYMNSNDYTRGNIRIGGTVFGGGEANEQGSETYDFDFISVTRGIIINIDGYGHGSFDILGSIFGSGNASSTSGYSRIYINNYGSENDIKNNISLQRADLAVLNNSYMALSGATDRTNEYSQVEFSLSRITELDLKNSSSIYLERGANLLNRFRSLKADGTIAEVDIDDTTHEVDRNGTNNCLYMLEDKVLNIALNQNVTSYGEVDGMTFFGMFKRDRENHIVKAMYNSNYTTGSSVTESELYYFSSGSYVLGLHETNHNIEVDGFYTNYADLSDGTNKIMVDYIIPTPENAEHYMWNIGLSVQSYDIEMMASKYSTLGTVEFPFVNDATGNTRFSVVGFRYDELDPDISIINPDNVPRIAATGTDADNNIGLAIKPGIGWVSVGSTYFLTDSAIDYDGTITYKSENSNITPSFIFYLYHSKNLQTEGPMGTVTVVVKIEKPIDDLTFDVHLVNFNITLSRVIYDTNDYEGAMTPGRQYEMFTSSTNDITSKSSISAYYSLYMESNQNIYRNDYHRVLTSNVILPVNTKITMIDFASSSHPEYYYYIVNQADNTALSTASNFNVSGEIEYPLSNFIRMGSLDTTNKYDDSVANGIYYDSVNHRAIEEFIFIIDFKDATINNSMYDCSLLIDMLDNDGNIVHSVLGIQRSNLVYSLYTNQQSAISVDATVSKQTLYAGDTQDLRVTITFNQSDVQSQNRIVDTTYYEQKVGIMVSFFDNARNKIVDGADLMGTSLTLDGKTYYARSDGTIRFKITDRVASSYSNIRINTENSMLEAGLYTVNVDAFYSTDGIYFGKTPADSSQTSFRMMSKSYGLQVTIPEEEIIIDSASGLNVNKTRTMHATITYSGSLIEPNMKVALYRRSYTSVNSLDYNLVNITNYVTNDVTRFGAVGSNIYDIIDELDATNSYTFNIGQELMTGTYRLEFRLYDGDAYVGNIIKYVIIK